MENVQGAEVAAPVSEATESEVGSNQVESQEESAQTQEAQAKPAAKAEPQSSKKKFKLKVDGEELEEELDLADEKELTKRLQLSKMAQKRAQEAADLRKRQEQIDKLFEDIQNNPAQFRALAKQLGIDEKQLAAMIIEEEIENSKKTPEQIEHEKLQAELKKLGEEKEKLKKEFEQKELERLQEKAFQEYDQKITHALETAELPKSPYAVKRIADYLSWGIEAGLDVPVDMIIPLVKEELMSDARELISALGDDALEEFMGKELMSKVRKRNIAKAKEKPPTPVSKQIADVGAEALKQAKPSAEAKKTIKQMFGI